MMIMLVIITVSEASSFKLTVIIIYAYESSEISYGVKAYTVSPGYTAGLTVR